MEMKESIQRVARMEAIFDESYQAVHGLLQAMQAYRAAEGALRRLEAYYQSPLWLQDVEVDRTGGFPQDMKRGILSEDSIYDLLTDEVRMMKLLSQLKKVNE